MRDRSSSAAWLSAALRSCPQCGASVAPGATDCSRCGVRLESSRHPEAPPERGRTRRTNLLLALVTLTLWAGVAWLHGAGYVEYRLPTDVLFLAVGFLVAAVGSGALDDWLHRRWGSRERERLLKIGVRTHALVAEVWGGDETYISYRYTPQGSDGTTERTETLYRLATRPEVGQRLEIVYDPTAPQYSAIIDPQVIAATGGGTGRGDFAAD